MTTTADSVEVKERPIIFSAPMVRAILEGRKTQTRRAIRPQPLEGWMTHANTDWSEYYTRGRFGLKKHLWIMHPTKNREIVCPYGKPGDRLWMRESWYCAGEHECDGYPVRYEQDAELIKAVSTTWRTPIFMPRWASRITLEITNVRVERLQEITAADAKAEGIEPFLNRDATAWRAGFQIGWDSINGKRKGCAWSDNPFVWIVEFRKL